MANKAYEETHIQDIADAIREKNGGTETYTVAQMGAAVRDIETGIDTSDATATAEDMAEGVTAYVDGKKVTGTLEDKGVSFATTDASSVSQGTYNASTKSINMVYTIPSDAIYRAGYGLTLRSEAMNFGDATAADVAAGKTFTSAAGLVVTGTATASGGGSGIVSKTGTTTEATFDTGFSDVSFVVLYRSVVSSAGLVSVFKDFENDKGSGTYCSSYSTYTKTYSQVGVTNLTKDGGAVTWGGAGSSVLASGVTYTWIAYGTE